MIFNDTWTEGLNAKQQKLIVDYVMAGCKAESGQGDYKSLVSINTFLKSIKGRRAVRAYCEFFFDRQKDTVKMQLLKINMERAFYNPADIINSQGRLLAKYKRNLTNLNGLAYCIEGIEYKQGAYGNDIKIKLADRDKARDFVVQLFKIFEEDEKENFLDEKSVFEMTDDERDEEIKKLLDKQKLIENGGKKDEMDKI